MHSDLHIHSKYSDGTNTIEEIVDIAKKNNVSCISLVDHDTVDGVLELKEKAKKHHIEVINGVEISTSVNKTRIHILGYGIDLENANLKNYLKDISKARTENTKAILESNIKRGTIKYSWENVMHHFSNYSWLNSSHVFEAMKNDGLYDKWSDFFDFYTKYFGINCGVYEDIEGFTAESAIKVINESGGIPVIAHPKLIRDDAQISKLAEYGALGIEAYHPVHDKNEIEKYIKIAKEHNLILTGGTDWHGEWSRYGVEIGGSGINEKQCNTLKEMIKTKKV